MSTRTRNTELFERLAATFEADKGAHDQSTWGQAVLGFDTTERVKELASNMYLSREEFDEILQEQGYSKEELLGGCGTAFCIAGMAAFLEESEEIRWSVEDYEDHMMWFEPEFPDLETKIKIIDEVLRDEPNLIRVGQTVVSVDENSRIAPIYPDRIASGSQAAWTALGAKLLGLPFAEAMHLFDAKWHPKDNDLPGALRAIGAGASVESVTEPQYPY